MPPSEEEPYQFYLTIDRNLFLYSLCDRTVLRGTRALLCDDYYNILEPDRGNYNRVLHYTFIGKELIYEKCD